MLFSALLSGLGLAATAAAASRPNIVMIMTDDQDKRLWSTDFQGVLQREMVAKGTNFTNHYTSQALCCPSRSSLLRGQMTHNTNITNVVKPGGSYNKWVQSGQDLDYLPHWLKAAGYRNEYIGKIMNGYGISNYDTKVKGYDWTDLLVEPYIDDYNLPVFSQNGEKPVFYDGWHQTDVIRIKALDRLDQLTADDQTDPFTLTITPFSPHVAFQQNNPSHRPIPCKRHLELFPEAKAPRTPNFNPADEFQTTHGGWLKSLKKMNTSAENFADFVYRTRAQALQGVDEIIEDVLAKLEDKGILDNTYVIFTSDNGYHLGQHRAPAGKSLFYNEDVNIPFIVRGPNVPAGVVSNIPGMHLDLAPTFLEIAGVAEADYPTFLDGRSLLPQWHSPETSNDTYAGQGSSKEAINVEYWGNAGIEAPSATALGSPFVNTTYKTIRVLGSDQGWVYTHWCNGDTELYDTHNDPWELTNLLHANSNATITRMAHRLNALLMVTKSCEQDRCRDPWSFLKPNSTSSTGTATTADVASLVQAMNPDYDDYFSNFDQVHFETCLAVQKADNEAPHFPRLATLDGEGLGRAHRSPTDVIDAAGGKRLIQTANYYGTAAQRNGTLAEIRAASRVLNATELAVG